MSMQMPLGSPVLDIRGFSYRYPTAETPIFKNVSLKLAGGQCIGLVGPSGSGKTTLLLAIQGLLKTGRALGTIALRGGNRGRACGLVFQSADTQILCSTVADEVSFGLENIGCPQERIARQVVEALRLTGLQVPGDHSVDHLSAGQKQRLTIAAVMAMRPRLVMLDEPTAQLDETGKRGLINILKALKNAGHGLFIADHDVTTIAEVADTWAQLKAGSLTLFPKNHVPCGKPLAMPSPNRQPQPGTRQTVIRARGLCKVTMDGRPLFNKLDVTLKTGELAYLYGPNGVGKSTLLRCLTGFDPIFASELQVAGRPRPKPSQLVGRVSYLLQNPQQQLFANTVRDEVAYSLKRLNYGKTEVIERAGAAMKLCAVGHLADRSPLMLSFGEQHRVALASALAPQPCLVLLDEPFAGLDGLQRQRVLDLLCRYRDDHDAAVLLASHNPLPDGCRFDRMWRFEEGRLETL
jgi:energy-coupling factor transporter ATP-binding protein EcfA2